MEFGHNRRPDSRELSQAVQFARVDRLPALLPRGPEFQRVFSSSCESLVRIATEPSPELASVPRDSGLGLGATALDRICLGRACWRRVVSEWDPHPARHWKGIPACAAPGISTGKNVLVIFAAARVHTWTPLITNPSWSGDTGEPMPRRGETDRSRGEQGRSPGVHGNSGCGPER